MARTEAGHPEAADQVVREALGLVFVGLGVLFTAGGLALPELRLALLFGLLWLVVGTAVELDLRARRRR